MNLKARTRCTSPFPGLLLTPEDEAHLEALACMFVDKTKCQFEEHIKQSSSLAQSPLEDDALWSRILKKQELRVYQEKFSSAASSTSSSSNKGSSIGCSPPDCPVLVAQGTVRGTIDDVMYGVVSPTSELMRVKTSYLKDHIVGAAVLASLTEPTPSKPFESLSVKWVEKGSVSPAMRLMVRNRDLVYMEATGTGHLANGDRIGYHLLHSVHFPQTHELRSVLRGNQSVCSIYRQKNDDTVEIFVKAVTSVGSSGLLRKRIVHSMAHEIIAVQRYLHCARMKKLAWFMRRSTPANKPSGSSDSLRTSLSSSLSSSRIGRTKQQWQRAENCGLCKHPFQPAPLLGSSKRCCRVCQRTVCSSCRTRKRMSLRASDQNSQEHIVQKHVTVCNDCMDSAEKTHAMFVAADEIEYGDPRAGYGDLVLESCGSTSSEQLDEEDEGEGVFGWY